MTIIVMHVILVILAVWVVWHAPSVKKEISDSDASTDASGATETSQEV